MEESNCVSESPVKAVCAASGENVGLLNGVLDDNIIAAMQIKITNKIINVGFAAFDKQNYCFKFCEYNDSSNFDTTENLLVQIRPECISVFVPSECFEKKRLFDIFESFSISWKENKKKDFSCLNIEEDISRLLLEEDSIKNYAHHLKDELSIGCIACILFEHSMLSSHFYFKQCKFCLLDFDKFLRLDKAALSALNIFPKAHEGKRSAMSVFGFLNKCKTKIGARKLVIWMSQPLNKFDAICQRHNILDILINNECIRQSLEAEHLNKVPDLDVIASKLRKVSSICFNNKTEINESKKLKLNISLEDIVRLYDCVVSSSSLLCTLNSYDGAHQETLKELFVTPLNEVLSNFTQFVKLVEHTIDLKEAENNNFVINREFDEKLKKFAEEKENIKMEMAHLRQKVEESIPFQRINRRSSGTTSSFAEEIVKICEYASEGFVFRVTKKDRQAVQEMKGKFFSIRLNKGEFLFTNFEMRSLCKQYENACRMYDEFQSGLVEKSLSVASTYWPLVIKLSDIYSSLDVLFAYSIAICSSPFSFCRPTINEGGDIKLESSRHLLIENSQRSTSFISNDLFMNRESSRVHIITGPNMGGKSTYIRQVALIIFLNQIGFYVPCASADLPLFNKIMCRVGASDIQLKGVSTFLSEMIEASTILKSACERSLIVIDELGRGTSTYEGFGLAWAIAKYIANHIKCFCFFATHFHEMGELAYECEGVVNYYVSAGINRKENKLVFLYKVKKGCSDQSYGVNVAEMAKFPKEIIERARQKSEELECVEHIYGLKHKKLRTINSQCELTKQEVGEGEMNSYSVNVNDEEEHLKKRTEFLGSLKKLKSYLKELFTKGNLTEKLMNPNIKDELKMLLDASTSIA